MLPLNKIIIGRIGSPYGLQGWLKVQSFTDPQSNICNYPEGWLQYPTQKTWHPYQAHFKQLSKALLIKLAACNNPETARTLTGAVLAIEREALPKLPKDEYYWSDLENLKVTTKAGVFLGTVDYLIATGANDVMVIQNRLIPYIDDVIIEVNLEKKEIIVDWDVDF